MIHIRTSSSGCTRAGADRLYDQAVAAEQREIGGKVRPEETRGLLFFDYDVPRARRDRRDDLVAVDIVAGVAAGLVAPRALPAPAAGIPVVRAPLPGSVDDREPPGARRFYQLLDIFKSHPALLAT